MKLLGYWSYGLNGESIVYVDGNGVLRLRDCRKNRRVVRSVVYVDERGDIRVRPQTGAVYGRGPVEFKRAFGERYFGDCSFLVGVDGEYVDRILRECDGKTEDEVVKVCEKYRAMRNERKTEREKETEKWRKLREKFDGVVIGLDSKIDVYDAGFTVRVLFGSDIAFAGKKKFVAENRTEFLKWVMHELSESKRAMRKIGDMRYYRPVEIVVLRSSEVEVKFEVKKEVA